MDDLISRQAATEILVGVKADNDMQNYDIGFNDAIDFAISTLSVMSNAQRWIPVSERLPKMAGTYLVTNSMIGYHQIEITYFEDGQWDTGGMPIAWSRLPEPFKGEE